MTDLLSELKEACQHAPTASDEEMIARGGSTTFRGAPAHADQGTVALSLGRDARVIINERDVRAVTRDGDGYSVEISSDAHVLLRVEKSLKATPQPHCRCGDQHSDARKTVARERVGLEIGPITVCEVLCATVVIDNGRQSVVTEICIPVNCHVEKLQSE